MVDMLMSQLVGAYQSSYAEMAGSAGKAVVVEVFGDTELLVDQSPEEERDGDKGVFAMGMRVTWEGTSALSLSCKGATVPGMLYVAYDTVSFSTLSNSDPLTSQIVLFFSCVVLCII